MNKSTLVPREEMNDLDWLARNVHVWREGKHEVLVSWPRNVGTLTWSSVSSTAGWITKEQWLARRAELQNKPSWGSVGSDINFISQHDDGQWIGHSEKPSEAAECFECNCVVSLFGYGEVLGDWRDTLEKRPEELKQFTSIEDNQEQDMTQQQEMKRDNGWFERGELPPVGSSVTVVEVDGLGLSDLGREFVGEECKVMATFTRPELSHSDAVDVVVVMEQGGGCCCFVLEMIRPIRTERDMLLSIITEELNHYDTDGKLADAILAAGFSLGAK